VDAQQEGDDVADDQIRCEEEDRRQRNITNTMIVVIVVPRRVGQVTLAVPSVLPAEFERAIVGYQVLRETIVI
jgi:hypothetical protein